MAHKPKKQRKRHDPELDQAILAFKSGDLHRAESLYRTVLQRRPRLAEAHYALALIKPRIAPRTPTSRADALRQSREHLQNAVRLAPSNALYHYALGGMLRDDADLEAALEAYTRAGWLDPSLADCHADAASLLERLGRFDEAHSFINRALKADPGHHRARVFQIQIEFRRADADEQTLGDWARTLRPVAEEAPAPLTRSLAWSILADIHDKLRQAPEAFEAFTRCNDTERRLQDVPSDDEREQYLRSIDDLAASIHPQKTDAWTRERPDDQLPAPALLVGFPRSGTTMTERAIDAHPRARSIEEQPTFEDTKSEMARLLGPTAHQHPFHEALDLLTIDHVAQLRAFYWRRAASEIDADPADVLVLDKLPIRIAELAFVNRIFPEARVLVALRDPRDVCLSCFRQRFTINVPMSFFLDIRDTARLYRHVMHAWIDARDAYSFPWLEIRYENTVADFEPRIRAILEFLSLEWDDAVLSFHERTSERASRTPSYHTIRDKVSTRAVGRWKRYEQQLEPILPTLQPFVEAFTGGDETRPPEG